MKGKIAIAAAILALAVLWINNRTRPPAPAMEQPTPPPAVSSVAPPFLVPQLPEPPPPPVASTPAPAESPPENGPANFLARLLHNGETIKLNREQVESYLAANRRNAASLITAFRATGDTHLLREAMEQFPRDPRVDFAAACQPGATPEERRHWLEAFKQSAPDNSLANYLSAFDYFKAGQNDQAVLEMQAAYGKKSFEDYSLEFLQDEEEAYRAAGYSAVEAKALAFTQLPLPHLRELRETGADVVDLAKSYRQSGDEQSAQAALQLGMNLARQLQDPGTFNPLINELVGIVVERRILESMDPASAYGSAGQTIQGRLDEIAGQRQDIKSLAKQVWPLLETSPEQDMIGYFDRTKVFGELSAMNWLLDKHPPQARSTGDQGALTGPGALPLW